MAPNRKHKGKAKAIEDEATVDINVEDVLKLQPTAPPRIVEDEDSDRNSELDEQERLEVQKNGKKTGEKDTKGRAKAPTAFQQRELVALAFAGDNVVEVCRLPADPRNHTELDLAGLR